MSLTEMSHFVRRAIVLTIIFFILLIVGNISIKIGRAVYLARYPKKDLPTATFGKLPKLNIPSLALEEQSTPEYFLETVTGGLPNLGELAYVYKLKEKKYSLLSEDKTRELAKSLGFKSEPKSLSSTEFFWSNAKEGRTLNANVITGNFRLETDLNILSDSLIGGAAPSHDEAVRLSGSILKNLTPDYSEGEKETTLVKIKNGTLSQALSLAEAVAGKVDYFRAIENIPILGPNPKAGLIQVYVTKSAESQIQRFPIIYFTNWEIEKSKNATYPLITVSAAYNAVVNGRANIVHLKKDTDDPFTSYSPFSLRNITINNIFLGYFDSLNFQKFLQPIYVFQGRFVASDGNGGEYIAYYPAIAKEWLEE